MRELQAIFETPPRVRGCRPPSPSSSSLIAVQYGKSLDWKNENYTPHDVASVFRRYLTQMPFRDAIAKKPYNQDEVIATYKRLIASMPRANQYLLLYVLDLLSVFARKSAKNLMTAQSASAPLAPLPESPTPVHLAVIFRPGIMSHPDHELSPKEHQLSQEVLEFLIAHQDWFMLDIPPPPPASAPGAGAGAHDVEEGMVSSSDEERATGGWKLVHPHAQAQAQAQGEKKIARRRTTTERERGSRAVGADLDSDLDLDLDLDLGLELGRGRGRGLGLGVAVGSTALQDLSPVRESHSPSQSHSPGGAALGISRSHTLPSAGSRSEHAARAGRAGSGNGSGGGSGAEDEKRVLRKARRASGQVQAQQQALPHAHAHAHGQAQARHRGARCRLGLGGGRRRIGKRSGKGKGRGRGGRASHDANADADAVGRKLVQRGGGGWSTGMVFIASLSFACNLSSSSSFVSISTSDFSRVCRLAARIFCCVIYPIPIRMPVGSGSYGCMYSYLLSTRVIVY
ncbi:hypothetical protein EVG20_g10789 [Dentipellis fragilis]|uniref:Rho-GAP domain-containing protein n=1 Tax=Dentipellis fragilis TaxID=205917 RepID=A0A4Y9XP62_9AGAM|nr:hypothetical protein EVG20_g10789 [Dentipellis fragilis]